MTADELQRWASILRWVGLSVTTIGIIITFGSHYVADKLLVVQRADKAKAQERQKFAEDQISAAHTQAEEANKLVAALEARGQPRTVTPEQNQALRAAMRKGFSGGLTVPIIIASKMLDPECESYSKQLSDALAVPPEALGLTPLGAFTFQGIRIFSVGEAAADSAEKIRRAFQTVGIPFSPEPYQAKSCPIHPDVGVFIFVGYK
ncbi:hypothetical protein [Verrucomicrobium sp. BvORR106]|uniref:hypothetical protein n=1 Tax=Verrucomicrobium sp. BvORR106 TaxID=1403819 RepID=UPI002240FCD1|nr:hypothetical protein [Verrucomicrobium sp. BvORR106]